MFTHQSFSILVFAMKKRARQGRAPLYFRITINGQRAEISANRQAPLSGWDPKSQKVKGNNTEATGINIHLDAIKTSLNRHHSRLVTLGKTVTPSMLKNEYLGITDDRKTIVEVIDFFLTRYKEKVKKGLVSSGTQEKYERTFRKIKGFIKKRYKMNDISMNEIDNSFMEDFEHYLMTDCGLSNNTAMKAIGQAKSIFIMAHNRGWVLKNPTASYVCSFEDKDPLRLEIEELYTVCTKELKNTRLCEARDCYVFMCFTGYAYIDVLKLGHDNIFIGPDSKKWVTKDRQKTDSTECVPLFPIPLQLIEKYRGHPKCGNKNRLLPVNSNQRFNGYLKEIAAICGINKELTTHTARHTFATTVTLENGVPLETVGKMLGHRSIKSTMRYARVTRKKISENMAVLQERLFTTRFSFAVEDRPDIKLVPAIS